MRPMNAFVVCQYLWAGWIVIWLLWAFQSKKTQHRENILSRLSYSIVIFASMYLMFFGTYLGPWLQGDIFRRNMFTDWTAALITALGFGITIWARYTLGGNWSGNVTVKVEHELIRTGPYRWVRHPIYTGMVVAMIGTAIARDEARAVLSIILLWVGFTIKRLREEQFMRQTFGSEYTDYAQTTGAIFPRVLRHRP